MRKISKSLECGWRRARPRTSFGPARRHRVTATEWRGVSFGLSGPGPRPLPNPKRQQGTAVRAEIERTVGSHDQYHCRLRRNGLPPLSRSRIQAGVAESRCDAALIGLAYPIPALSVAGASEPTDAIVAQKELRPPKFGGPGYREGEAPSEPDNAPGLQGTPSQNRANARRSR